MNVLITGGFGSIGVLVIEECLRRGHAVTVFEVSTKRTRRLSRRFGRRGVRAVFGDIRSQEDVSRAATGQDAAIHMAAILPPTSDRLPDLCERVNVGGTENLIRALRTGVGERDARAPLAAAESAPASFVAPTSPLPAMVCVSSASVMGPTQKRTPPVRPGDPLVPTDVYSRSKFAAESLTASSGLPWYVLRLAGVIPTVINYGNLKTVVKLLFSLPLEARCEMVIYLDVAAALVSAAENLTGRAGAEATHGYGGAPVSIAGKREFIGGGKSCQITSSDLVNFMFPPYGPHAAG